MKKNIFTIILLILVLGLGGFIAYDKLLAKEENKETNEDKKIEVCECNEDNTNLGSNETTLNNYQIYVDHLKEKRSAKIISNIDNVETPFEKIGINSIEITNDGTAKIEGTATGVKEIKNVLTAYVVSVGNAGFRTVVFIKEDGTLLAMNASKLVNEKTIEYITDFGLIKDIISLNEFGNFSIDPNGFPSVNAIDINGNTYDITNYLINQ